VALTDDLFVTGQLAKPALEETLAALAPKAAAGAPDTPAPRVAALRIKVAALMTTDYIRNTLRPGPVARIVLPGLCQADTGSLAAHFGLPVVKGPKDLRDLPEFLGGEAQAYDPQGPHDLTLLAEINDVASLDERQVLALAERHRRDGADVIDLGCSPERPHPDLGRLVRRLVAEGHRVSIDTFDEREALAGDEAGAEMILSLNGSNLHLAARLHAVPVVLPDPGEGIASLFRNVRAARERGAKRVIADPILEPIPFGFAASVVRFAEARAVLPDTDLLMGVGNLSELTEADSTGVNALLCGLMSELDVRYALTTEVAGWARGSVRELDCGRRMMHHAKARKTLAKGYDHRLVTTRDPRVRRPREEELHALQSRVTDRNFRIDTDGEAIYIYNSERFVRTTDIRAVFPELGVEDDASHAFYLGRELMKAEIARRLGKKYIQGEPLEWGYLTWTEEEEAHARRA
jgi:dihydropteroate synthase-like protein